MDKDIILPDSGQQFFHQTYRVGRISGLDHACSSGQPAEMDSAAFLIGSQRVVRFKVHEVLLRAPTRREGIAPPSIYDQHYPTNHSRARALRILQSRNWKSACPLNSPEIAELRTGLGVICKSDSESWFRDSNWILFSIYVWQLEAGWPSRKHGRSF